MSHYTHPVLEFFSLVSAKGLRAKCLLRRCKHKSLLDRPLYLHHDLTRMDENVSLLHFISIKYGVCTEYKQLLTGLRKMTSVITQRLLYSTKRLAKTEFAACCVTRAFKKKLFFFFNNLTTKNAENFTIKQKLKTLLVQYFCSTESALSLPSMDKP